MSNAPNIIEKLVELFGREIDNYKSSAYNETQLRTEFINPFWEALGWDVTNKKGYALPYRDVKEEFPLKLGLTTKAPDYCFTISGKPKFFLETKKPSVDIKHDIDPAYQLRRYGWSGKLSLSLLSDFEEMSVYDCRIKPKKTDKSSIARINYYSFRDYLDKWDEIESVFARESILQGSFDKYVETTKGKRGTTEVDSEFLKEIEKWREKLAKNIALRNPKLKVRELNFAVQKTIDRIIFLRMAEDRGIENYQQLYSLCSGPNIYDKLVQVFLTADDKYNSGLFHFKDESGRTSDVDSLTPRLKIDDKTLKDILKNLYYPDCPYEFSFLPSEILGNVYEQFLGKVIRLTKSHQARIEEKPEVKKAGGVYYTPEYIVEYIVENTVGKLCDKKTPKKISELKILDPACGSGSFLIGAYKYLLDYHLKWYLNDKKKKGKIPKQPELSMASKGKRKTYQQAIFQSHDGEWHLTTSEKKRILLNNIYGVDIDPQAVEVTKLSLLLKVLENENAETLKLTGMLFKERALPDLGHNIKCGNSLIGSDFYSAADQMQMFDTEERYRINAFDWHDEFPEIFKTKNPGFDAVIGNPPYIFTRNTGIDESDKAYFYAHYKYQSAQLNTFALFIEKADDLINTSGHSGFIIPNNWLTIDSFSELRKFILQSNKEITILNIIDHVFHTASVDNAIILMHKDGTDSITLGVIESQRERFKNKVNRTSICAPSYIIKIWLAENSHDAPLIDKINLISKPLKEFCTVSTGLKAYQIGKGKPPQTETIKEGRIFHSSKKKDRTYKIYLEGVDVKRYRCGWSGNYLSYGDWLAEPRKSVPFDGPRILVRQIPSKPPHCINAVHVEKQMYNDINSMVVFVKEEVSDLKYILGLLNSRLISFWFVKQFDKFQRKIFPQFKVKELAQFPIRSIDHTNTKEKAHHDKMIKLVDNMLSLNKQIQDAKTPHDKEMIQREIDATDKQIDRLVYELYGLSDEEIKIVEESAQNA